MYEFFVVLLISLLIMLLFLVVSTQLFMQKNNKNLFSGIYLDYNSSNPEYIIRSAYQKNRFLRNDITLILIDGGMQEECRNIAERLADRLGIPIISPEKMILYFREL